MNIENQEPLSQNEIFQILSSHRRQRVIEICERATAPVSLSDLAQEIAAIEEEKEITELTGTERKRIYTSLQQTHLPRMARAEVINYDGRTIELTKEGSAITEYTDMVPPGTISWAVYYFGLSLISAITVAGVYIDIYPAYIPDITWAVLITILVGSSSIVQLYTTGQLPTNYFPLRLK